MRRRQFMAAISAAHGTERLDGATISREVSGLLNDEITAQRARYDIAAHDEPMPLEAAVVEPPKRITRTAACTKCGKLIGRGIAMHTKKCAGLTDG